eukprot:TRINITY_DN1548_c0_g1_i7.p1 TRINITY_DN1548_c0_g1~~TRINITY_DN1548_c0_g1_i7.p1  ORF type:complete len:362 (-),score=72.53 TRINITY_DN1548_c0_g1_i7:35-1120(-)
MDDSHKPDKTKQEVQTGVPFTSLIVAAARAQETLLPEETRLINDPFAADLVNKEAEDAFKFLGQIRADQEYPWNVITFRTRFIDNFIKIRLKEMKSSVSPQIVILGSGMDTRAYRMDCLKEYPNLSFFEVDYGHVLEYKKNKLAEHHPTSSPLCNLRYVPIDLSLPANMNVDPTKPVKKKKTNARRDSISNLADPWPGKKSSTHENETAWAGALEIAGFDKNVKTIWILEGLVMYLQKEEVRKIMRDIGRLSCKGSEMVVHFIKKLHTTPHNAEMLNELGMHFKFMVEEPEEIFDPEDVKISYEDVGQTVGSKWEIRKIDFDDLPNVIMEKEENPSTRKSLAERNLKNAVITNWMLLARKI